LEAFKKKHGKKIRSVVIKEVEKLRDCGSLKNGFKIYVCEGCHDVRHVPLSRILPTLRLIRLLCLESYTIKSSSL